METIKQVSTCGFAICTSPFIELFLLLLLFLVPSAVLGAQSAPDTALRTATADVIAALKQDRDITDDPKRLGELIESKVLPVFDFSLMTQFAVGKSWRHTSAAQQGRLIAEFRTLLVRSYSGMLATYRDHAITYKAIRYQPGDSDATVRSEVTKPGAKSLDVEYQLTRMTGRGWKVYDVKLNGVSVITAHREAFAARIRASGFDGLIRSLAEKNRQQAAFAGASLVGG